MKVLHMLQSDRFSGAENVVCQIISMCRSEGVEFAYSSQDGQIREALKERNIDFHPIKKTSISEFKRVINEVKPDVIHAHDMGASFYAALSCGKIPLISHIHNNALNSRKVSIKSLLYYVAAKKAKHIFWVSQSSFDGYVFHKSLKVKSSVLYNIIDIDALIEKMNLDIQSYPYDVIFLGRLTAPKNPHRLIEVFEKVAMRNSNVKIAIVGTGEMETEIRQLVKDKGLTDQVSFLGFQSNPTKILHDAKVMVMTSLYEGTPMCALEAMALGVPIVSTPTDGLRELVESGKTGYLSDDDNVLAEKICAYVLDDDLRSEASENSINKARIINDIEKYRDVIMLEYTKISIRK